MSEAKPCLSEQQAKTIIARLQLAYGKTFTDKWQDVPQDALIADWAQRLGAYAGDDEAVAYALERLPPAFPPTAMEFAELCRRCVSKRLEAEQAAAWREYEALLAPDGMEWCEVWINPPDGYTVGKWAKKLLPKGSGWQRTDPPADVVAKAKETMKERFALVRIASW